MTNKDIAALVGSRICHDLISPLSAIGNGVELLQMTTDTPSAEVDLIAGSVKAANARIRFFRIAYGHGGDTSIVGAAEVRSLMEAMNEHGRVNVSWDCADDLPRGCTKTAFLFLQCLETAMPYGGTIKVTRSDTKWAFTALAKNISHDTTLWSLFDDIPNESAVTPSHVHFLLASGQLAHFGRKLSYRFSDDSIELTY